MAVMIRRCALVLSALLAGTLSAQDTPRTARAPTYDGEWSFVRLAYDNSYISPACNGGRGGFRGGGGGGRRLANETDYPDAEINLRQGLERLTRTTIGREQYIRPDDPDLMNYPWLYAVEVGHWDLDEAAAENLREYLLRGGFLMVDDFHGTDEYAVFEKSMQRVFPDRPILEIDESDPLMSVVYNLDKSIQIPGNQFISSRVTYECDGYEPHWQGIYDDEGNLMVAINFNMDLGDAWEHADNPAYPEPMTGLAIRFAVNYVIYSMTH